MTPSHTQEVMDVIGEDAYTAPINTTNTTLGSLSSAKIVPTATDNESHSASHSHPRRRSILNKIGLVDEKAEQKRNAKKAAEDVDSRTGGALSIAQVQVQVQVPILVVTFMC